MWATSRVPLVLSLGLLLLVGCAASDAPRTPLAAVGTVSSEAVPLQDGSCGDNRCAPPEDCRSCPSDCGDCCGDHRCAPPEDCRSCPGDCC